MSLDFDFVQTVMPSFSGLLGALAGGLFTMRASKKAYQREMIKELRREEKEIQNMLDAMGVEIGTLWKFHMSRIGAMIESLPEGTALEFYYPLTQDYFTVYNTNAGKIGAVKNPELREAVVICYKKCKKVVDGFKYNNILFRDYRDLLLMPADSPNHMQYVNAKRQELVDFAQVIVADHFEVKGYVERLLALLANRSSHL